MSADTTLSYINSNKHNVHFIHDSKNKRSYKDIGLELWGNKGLSFHEHTFNVDSTTVNPNLRTWTFTMPAYGIASPETTNSADLWLSGWSGVRFFTSGALRMSVLENGNVDIKNTLHAKEILVDNDNWSDFVFDENYNLPTLQEVEKYISTKKHLPDIPSAEEVQEKGVKVSEMQSKLLQKIEELTLYIIQQNKRIEQLEQQNQKR